jgi:hypothetical protein
VNRQAFQNSERIEACATPEMRNRYPKKLELRKIFAGARNFP